MFFKIDHRLMQVKSITECSEGSILQYFQPSLSKNFFFLFLVGHFTQVLLYMLRTNNIEPWVVWSLGRGLAVGEIYLDFYHLLQPTICSVCVPYIVMIIIAGIIIWSHENTRK